MASTLGDMKIRSKLKFEVVTAKVVEESGKKHVVSSLSLNLSCID